MHADVTLLDRLRWVLIKVVCSNVISEAYIPIYLSLIDGMFHCIAGRRLLQKKRQKVSVM